MGPVRRLMPVLASLLLIMVLGVGQAYSYPFIEGDWGTGSSSGTCFAHGILVVETMPFNNAELKLKVREQNDRTFVGDFIIKVKLTMDNDNDEEIELNAAGMISGFVTDTGNVRFTGRLLSPGTTNPNLSLREGQVEFTGRLFSRTFLRRVIKGNWLMQTVWQAGDNSNSPNPVVIGIISLSGEAELASGFSPPVSSP